MLKKIIIPICVVAVALGLIVEYNSLFLRTMPASNSLLEKVNPIPYMVYFDYTRGQPHAIFQTPIFPSYNTYCHDNHKLCQFIPLQQLYADMLWISSIQYIGVNLGKQGDLGLYSLFDTLTSLSPYWSYPYAFSQLVLPVPKLFTNTGDNLEIGKRSWENAVTISKKGEAFLCDPQKMAAITGMTEEEFIDKVYTNEGRAPYLDPCTDYEIPHYTAFNEFYYLGDAESAADQYRISAFHQGAPSLTPMMAALVYGRGGEHLKSATIWFERYTDLADSEDTINSEDAKGSLQKAIFETQLQLITEAADATPECGTSYTCLQQKGAIAASVSHSRQDTCESGKNTQNMRCILMDIGMQNKYISLNGKLVYPADKNTDKNFEFLWSKDYNSWWAQPTF